MEPVHLKHTGFLGGTENGGLTNHSPYWTNQ